ncbi:MAG: DUF4168 domain-containing protein [Rhizobiaceae bacterium]
MKFLPKHVLAAVVSATLLAFAAGFAPAAAQQLAQTEPPASAQQVQVDDAMLQAFAQSTLEVEPVIDKWIARIEESETSEEAAQMREAGNQEIMQTVQANGIDMETYNQLYQVVQTNPEVATKVQRYRQQLQ